MAVVITSPEWGIYLGNFMGLGFWSMLDTAGQDCAVTFQNEEAARAHVARWEANGDPDAYGYAEVVPSSSDGYATVADLKEAGLAGYLGSMGLIDLTAMGTA